MLPPIQPLPTFTINSYNIPEDFFFGGYGNKLYLTNPSPFQSSSNFSGNPQSNPLILKDNLIVLENVVYAPGQITQWTQGINYVISGSNPYFYIGIVEDLGGILTITPGLPIGTTFRIQDNGGKIIISGFLENIGTISPEIVNKKTGVAIITDYGALDFTKISANEWICWGNNQST